MSEEKTPMEQPRRCRPKVEVRCPECGTRDRWDHLPKGGDRRRWCGHLFEDFRWHDREGRPL